MKLFILFLIFILSQCSLNKVVLHHGVHNLDKKQTKLKINDTNINDMLTNWPPFYKSTFDNDVYIYIERKTSSSKLTKLGKKVLLKNNVLVLKINNKGLLVKKDFYDINDMKSVKFDETITVVNYSKKSFIYNFLSTLRQKIDDPLGKKRIKLASYYC